MMNHAMSLDISIATGRAFTIFPLTVVGRCMGPCITNQAENRSTASKRSPWVMNLGGRCMLCPYCAQNRWSRLYVALNSTKSGMVSRFPSSGDVGFETLNFGRTNASGRGTASTDSIAMFQRDSEGGKIEDTRPSGSEGDGYMVGFARNQPYVRR